MRLRKKTRKYQIKYMSVDCFYINIKLINLQTKLFMKIYILVDFPIEFKLLKSIIILHLIILIIVYYTIIITFILIIFICLRYI